MKIMILGGIPRNGAPKDRKSHAGCLDGISKLAGELAQRGHELILCSPFEGSADHAALLGIEAQHGVARIEFHFPDVGHIRKEVENWLERIPESRIELFPHHPPASEDPEALKYSWLLSQLNALDRASALVSIGGNVGASAELLLKLAHSRGRLVVPLTSLRGATARFFESHRTEYKELFGDYVEELNDAKAVDNLPSVLVAAIRNQSPKAKSNRRAFISYAKERSDEADLVEVVLRRRGFDVVRDESSFPPGHDIPDQIREKIFSSEIFVALWCAEYACSPWCYDELELSLDRFDDGKIALWILQLDETRMVPRRARDKLTFPARNREEIRAVLESLIAGKDDR